jgi:hypothetical protein
MHEDEAKAILNARARAGAALQVAEQGDLRSMKNLLAQCLEAEIPAMLGPCSVGG